MIQISILNKKNYLVNFINVLVIAGVIFFCYGLYAPEIKFFIDDYFFFTILFQQPEITVSDIIKANLLSWPQGRPMGFLVPQLLGYWTAASGSTISLQVIGLIFIFINALLIYKILYVYISNLNTNKILYLEAAFTGLAGSLIYLTFPADITKNMILSKLHIQPGLTLCLFGTLIFQKAINSSCYSHVNCSKIRIILQFSFTYLIASISLLFYETTFLPFFMAPALTIKWKDLKLYLCHFLVLLFIIVIYILVRKSFNDARLSLLIIDYNFLLFYITNIYNGIFIIISTYYNAIKDISYQNFTIVVLLSLFFCVWFTTKHCIIPYQAISFKNFFIILCFLPVSFIFCVAHSIFIYTGIVTTAFISPAAVFSFILSICINLKSVKYMGYPTIALIIAISAFYIKDISRNYVEMSLFQKQYTKNILNNIYDFEKGDTIILDYSKLETVNGKKYKPFMDTISWGNALALQLLLQYDKFNNTIPAMMTPIQNEHDLQCKNEMLVHKLRTPPFWEHETLLNPDKVFFLSMAKDGKIMRHDTLPEKFCKESLKLKPVSKKDLPVYDDKFFKFAFGN